MNFYVLVYLLRGDAFCKPKYWGCVEYLYGRIFMLGPWDPEELNYDYRLGYIYSTGTCIMYIV